MKKGIKPILLFGINELSERINYYLSINNTDTPKIVQGFVVDDEYCKTGEFVEKPVYPYSVAKSLFMHKIPILVCIGYKNMNANRQSVFNRLLDDGWEIGQYISSNAVINTENIGKGNIIIGQSVLEMGSKIGDGNIFDWGHVSHHSTIGNFNYLVSNVMGGSIIIEDNCFIGMKSCLRDGIYIKNNTLIGANCYMSHSTKKEGYAYSAPKAIKVGTSEDAMNLWS